MRASSCSKLFVALAVFACLIPAPVSAAEKDSPGLTATWSKNYLTIKGPGLPAEGIRTNYLEAFCRPGSTDREWGKTVIPHRTQLVSVSDDGRKIKLRSELADGVIVSHLITVGRDELDFRLVASNPTKKDSLVDWAQPCTRVGKFTGAGAADARVLYPKYIRKCFIYLDGRLTRLPTKPWAKKARYIPGQVYVPKGVNRNDVNPRPLSKLVPSSGLTGCYSADEKLILGIAWEPYQEIFQGVIACMHSDFRIGGLKAGESKKIRGKMYIVPADAEKLRKRYEKDFPEQK